MGGEGHPEASGHGSSKRRASRGNKRIFLAGENSRAFEPMPRAYPQSTEPPLTLMMAPVMCRARSEARKTMGPAMSSGGGILLSGMDCRTLSLKA